jgi:hypothetical protein
VTTQWRKSSYSTAIQDEACVELTRFPSVVGVRDSKNPEAGHLALSRRQFAGLTRRIKGSD